MYTSIEEEKYAWCSSSKGREPFSQGYERLSIKNVEESVISAATKLEAKALVHARLVELEEIYDCVKYTWISAFPEKNAEGIISKWIYKGKFICFEKLPDIPEIKNKGEER